MSLFKMAHKVLIAWDLRGCVYLNHWSRNLAIAKFFKGVSRLGDGPFWYAMLVLVWYAQGFMYLSQIVYLLVASSLATLLYKVLKQQTVRPRPYQVHQVIQQGERPLDHFSFPSGHTLHAVLVTTILGSIEPILLVVMLPFCLLVALSRMILGLHYPTDVVVGAVLGLVMAWGIMAVAPYFQVFL